MPPREKGREGGGSPALSRAVRAALKRRTSTNDGGSTVNSAGPAHHRRTIDTGVTADAVSQRSINAVTAKAARKARISGLREVLADSILRHYADGRAFTVAEALALVQPRYTDLEQPLTTRDINNALYRICYGAHANPRIYQTGGKRSGSYAVHVDGEAQPPPTDERECGSIISEIVALLAQLERRIVRAETFEARMKQLGIRFEDQP